MKIGLANVVKESFKTFAEKHGFYQQNEVCEEQNHSVEYVSNVFVVKLVKYRLEIYAWLNKIGSADNEIDMFNLLAYLGQSSLDVPASEYFYNELDIEKRYGKQLAYIVTTLDKHLPELTEFFSTGDYDSKVADVRKFMINKYPKLFKQDSGVAKLA